MPDEWTDGFCDMTVVSSVLDSFGGPPMNCMTEMSAGEQNVSYELSMCVWPGTSPDDAALEFTREGLGPLPDDHVLRLR